MSRLEKKQEKIKKKLEKKQEKLAKKLLKEEEKAKKIQKERKKEIYGIGKKKPWEKYESVQNSIPYKALFSDGIKALPNGKWSKTFEFSDLNYQHASKEEKDKIFSNYCAFLNSLDTDELIQITFVNEKNRTKDTLENIKFKNLNDSQKNTLLQKEYENMIRDEYLKRNAGIVKKKFITITVMADERAKAVQKLAKLQDDITIDFARIGSKIKELNGEDNVFLLYDLLHINRDEKLKFGWDVITNKTMSTKDVISPSSFLFKNKNNFKVGDIFAASYFLQITGSEVEDTFLSELLEVQGNIICSMYIKSIDILKAQKYVSQKIATIEAEKINLQQTAFRKGYDPLIGQSKITPYEDDAKEQLSNLQAKNEKQFSVGIVVTALEDTKENLSKVAYDLNYISKKNSCLLTPLDYQQEDAFFSSLPLGNKKISVDRRLETTSTAIFLPFTTHDLCFLEPGSLYYGRNPISQNMIYFDRKKLQNPAGLILGTPGSGKSFSTKRELVNAFLATDDNFIICDPEGEFSHLVKALGGEVIKIGTSSESYINPLDISDSYGLGEDGGKESPLILKSQFLISFCSFAKNSIEGLSGAEISAIDKAVQEVYKPYLLQETSNKPTLSDFYCALLSQDTKTAKNIAETLEIFITGTQNIFSHKTNVNINNRLISFDIKGLRDPLQKIAMLVIQDFVWAKVAENKENGKYTRYIVDEFHLLLRDPTSARYAVDVWKRFRKWNGIPTGCTQNVKDLLASPEMENLFDNSGFFYLLDQSPGDRKILADKLSISQNELRYITNAVEGSGLLKYGDVIIPFVDNFPKNTELYKLMTTKPNETRI